MSLRIYALLGAIALPAAVCQADTPSSAQIQALREQIAAIRAETEERLRALEAELARLQSANGAANNTAVAMTPTTDLHSSSRSEERSQLPSSLVVSGDFRLRHEITSGTGTSSDRTREVLRARLGARYDLAPWLSIGGRLVTGDPDDPNSSDVAFPDFADDLTVSLDQAYVSAHFDRWELAAGKIPNPFVRTELVWDGDVNPQGIGGTWQFPLGAALSGRVSALGFQINDQSDMTGAQIGLDARVGENWVYEVAAAYYDYDLGSLVGADAGDIRGNRLTPDGSRYLSDFNLVDLVATATWSGAETSWPIRLTGDYVRNTNAQIGDDSGYSLELLVGRASEPRDIRAGYGYSTAEMDAVLAAFSHDNTTLSANYRQHALAIDYVLTTNVLLNGTWYRYRTKDIDTATDESSWADRVRLNLQFQF
ncbi:MAG: putative porin [Steroidobacteraceae bacterium]